MKNRKNIQLLLLSLIFLAVSSCSSNVDPGWIKQAGLYVDKSGTQPTDSYNWRDTFYLIVDLNDAPSDTIVQASWIAVDTNRLQSDTVVKIDPKEARNRLVFEIDNGGNFWPVGQYQVNLYLNKTLIMEIPFEVHDTDIY